MLIGGQDLNYILWTISNAPRVGGLCYNFLEGQGQLCEIVCNMYSWVESLKQKLGRKFRATYRGTVIMFLCFPPFPSRFSLRLRS